MIRRLVVCSGLIAGMCLAGVASAQQPRGFHYWPRPELFDWVERLEPVPYRQRYNRPRYIGGKIASVIAPSSQEAMSWHDHKRRGSYRNHAGPIVDNYNYPKPWEMIPIGPLPASPQSTPLLQEVILNDAM